MNKTATRTLLLFCALSSAVFAQAQTWKLTRNKDGIKVYQSDNTGFKNIKVLATLTGSYDQFIAVLRNVGGYSNWVYANKSARILKEVDDNEYYYYSETNIPWPLNNRDAVVHARVERDPKGRFIRLTEESIPGMVTKKSGVVRITKSSVSWSVTQTAPGVLSIEYLFSAEPGGSVPAWIANNFADKGPYESFKKLSALLAQAK
jgi:hypothetical protein